MSEKQDPKCSPLDALHRELGARMFEFAGWDMPVQYSRIVAEHRAVREAAGLFDVSHMGEIYVEGKGATKTLRRLMTNDIDKLNCRHAQYTLMTTREGTCVDDLIILKITDISYLLVVNAPNIDADVAWLRRHKSKNTTVRDASSSYALLALQGPNAENILASCIDPNLTALAELRPFCFTTAWLNSSKNITALVSRTGYTGEDGFEIMVLAEHATTFWKALLEKEAVPCGLGARGTLRLEAGLPLYGHELTREHSVLEAPGLKRFIKLDKKVNFKGRKALRRYAEEGPKYHLIGFKMPENSPIPRPEKSSILSKRRRPIGQITSGGPSPTLGHNIGMAYVATGYHEPGTPIIIQVRDKLFETTVEKLPFYRRKRGD